MKETKLVSFLSFLQILSVVHGGKFCKFNKMLEGFMQNFSQNKIGIPVKSVISRTKVLRVGALSTAKPIDFISNPDTTEVSTEDRKLDSTINIANHMNFTTKEKGSSYHRDENAGISTVKGNIHVIIPKHAKYTGKTNDKNRKKLGTHKVACIKTKAFAFCYVDSIANCTSVETWKFIIGLRVRVLVSNPDLDGLMYSTSDS